MSLYSALYAGVSGLSSQSTAMAAVADNITNINTVAYKGVEAEFKTLVTGSGGGKGYSAGGVVAAPRAVISKQGLLQAASGETDLGIQGSGFFVTRTGSTGDDAVAFTRSGSFRPDNEGFLRNTGGYYLQGWRLDATGSFVNNGSLNELTPVRLTDLAGTAVASTSIQMRANLDSRETPFAGAYAAGDMATGAVTPNFSRTVEVYDAQGGAHNVTMSFLKTGPNAWVGEIYGENGETTAANDLLASGSIAFNPDGSLDLANSSPALFTTLNVSWTNAAGSSPVNLKLGSQDGLDGLTQFGSTSSSLTSTVDGGPLGNLAAVEVSESGVVNAIFEDGTSRPIFQLPLATFPNPDGLSRLSGNGYAVSEKSGGFALNTPGNGGTTGTIAAGTLEASTVDLAEEFTNMIRFQRAYSASSKIITTVDDMLQEVSALKR